MRKIVLALGLITLLAACNTIQGAGQDIQSAGEGVTDTAKKVKEKIDQ